MDLKDTYNRIAKDWHEDHKNDDWWEAGSSYFASLFKTGETILDVGCAGGFKSAYLSRLGLKVTGIDISEEFIALARAEVPEATFLAKDMREIDDLPVFDGIFAQASLLHIPRAEIVSTLKTLAAHLSQTGYIYVSVKEKREGKQEEEMKVEDDYGYSYTRFFSYFTLEEMREYFEQADLKVTWEKVHSSGRANWIQLIGQKA